MKLFLQESGCTAWTADRLVGHRPIRAGSKFLAIADMPTRRSAVQVIPTVSYRQVGQAMVEFVIILTIFMTMISGMMYFFRLHLYQFWADQEARYLGFEQTWVPKAYYKATGGDPVDALEGDAVTFSRPKVVSGLGVTRVDSPPKSMSDLIAGVLSRNDTKIEDVEIGGLVDTAYASQRQDLDDEASLRQKLQAVTYPSVLPKLDSVLEIRLHKGGFGERFCGAVVSTAEKYGVQARTNSLFDKHCPETVENQLSHYIGKQIDIPEMVRTISDRVDRGDEISTAIEQISTKVIAEGFYSFFYNEVNSKYSDAEMEILAYRVTTAAAGVDSAVTRMISDLRYVGSSAAIISILGEEGSISARGMDNRDSNAEKTFEDGVQAILQIDASNLFPAIGNGYFLNPTYLPVPPVFGPLAPGLFSGTMKTVLSLDGGDVNEIVNQTVKKVTVTYDSADGLFPAATRRFRTGVKLQTSFAIDTDPWHIERREHGTGDYRDIGGEFDSVHDQTEEGQLRRRVNGLWLFPTPPEALFDPLLSFVGLDALTSLVDAFQPVGDFLGQIKSYITDSTENPILALADMLRQIPFIGSIVPRIPVWPAVRPDAYPASVEMKDDKKMTQPGGPTRKFQDYIDEQNNFNPDPNPTFN